MKVVELKEQLDALWLEDSEVPIEGMMKNKLLKVEALLAAVGWYNIRHKNNGDDEEAVDDGHDIDEEHDL